MRVHTCEREGCPSPVYLIEFEPVEDPEGLLAIEEERERKAAAHDAEHHPVPA